MLDSSMLMQENSCIGQCSARASVNFLLLVTVLSHLLVLVLASYYYLQ